MHRLQQEAQLLRELAPHALDPAHQLAVLGAIHQRDQTIAHLQRHQIHRRHVFPGQVAILGPGPALVLLRDALHLHLGLARLPLEQVGPAEDQRGQAQEHGIGHARHDPQRGDHAPGHVQHARVGEHLAEDLLPHVLAAGHAGHDDRGRGGQHQRRDLRDQTVADGQQHVVGRGIADRHAVLDGPDGQAADDVHEQDQDAGDRVTANKLGGPVHRAIEVRLAGDLLAPLARLFLGQDARVEVGVDRHLLAGHGIQGEAGADFGDAPRALGDHHEVDDDQDGEHHQADGVVAAHHEVAEGLDHLARRVGPGMAFQQDHPGGRDVQRQAQQRGHQQHGRKYGEFQRPRRIHRDHDDHQRQRDIEGEQHVQRQRRQRQHHHRQHGDQQDRRAEPPLPDVPEAVEEGHQRSLRLPRFLSGSR